MKSENLIFIIINAILIYILYNKNNKKNMFESFSNEVENERVNLLDNLNYDLNDIINDDFTKEVYILENITDTNVYTKNTIPECLSDILNEKLKHLLYENCKDYKDGRYSNIDLERVYEEKDDSNNSRYVVILFVYDYEKFNSNKMLADFIINLQTKEFYLNTIEEYEKVFANIINNYDKKIYNFYENNKDYNYNGGYLSYNTPEEDLLEILNKNYLYNKKLSYLRNKSLNFSNIDFHEEPKYLDEYSNTELPINQIDISNKTICNKYINNTWDSNGLPIEIPIEIPNNCILHNTSTSQNINEPNKYPSFPLDNIEKSNYNWLIDPVRNNIIRQEGYVF
tara:strand:+ start:7178 stop:8194 length:1017 start_codon:yes stop_codon:yes gene_type:complete